MTIPSINPMERSSINSESPTPTAPPAAQVGESQSSISSGSEGKGFIATILSPIKCAAKAIASFITAVFKKVFCCFYGDSKEVNALKELQTTLNSMIEAQTAMFEKQRTNYQYDSEGTRAIREGKTKALAMIANLPQETKDKLVAEAKAQILSFNDSETEVDVKASAIATAGKINRNNPLKYLPI